jgi:hypothetical protein
MNDDTTLVVYRSAMHLYYTGTSTQINECSRCLHKEEDISMMSDARVTQQLLLCQDYGFYPTVVFRL